MMTTLERKNYLKSKIDSTEDFEILEKIDHKREDIGLLRVRTVALKNQNPKEIENAKGEDGKYLPNVVLDLDYTVVIPKKSTKK